MRDQLRRIIRRTVSRILGLRPRLGIRVAERFIAPARLDSIRVPGDALAGPPARIAVWVLECNGTAYRTGIVETVDRRDTSQLIAFPAFENESGAGFLLFVSEDLDFAGSTDRLRAFESRLPVRAAISVVCNVPHLAPAALRPDELDKIDVPAEALQITYFLDQCWCDPYGLFLSGWLHCHEQRLEHLEVQVGSDRVAVENFHERPDLLTIFPDFPDVVGGGFSVYVPCRPGVPVQFHVKSRAGWRTIPVELPRAELAIPKWSAECDASEPFNYFCDAVNEKQLTVLEIGSRLVGANSINHRQDFAGAGRYIGMDIHASPTVDVVGDVHALSKLVGVGALDAVFSQSVLEHLAMPWLVAAEINRALKIGGLVFHSAPQSWPLHEVPNDFWRFSDEGLKILFGPAFGFEIISAMMRNRMYMYPEYRSGPFLQTPLNPGFAEAIILARKVADVPSDATLGRAEPTGLNEQARLYPTHD